jgi:hypothetical protein
VDGSYTWQCVCVYTGVADSYMSPACVAPTPAAPARSMPTYFTVPFGWSSTQRTNCTINTDCLAGSSCAGPAGAGGGGGGAVTGVCEANGIPTNCPANVLNVVDGDTSTCAQFTNDHCYSYSGAIGANTMDSGATACDAYVTIDLGAPYIVSGLTIYGSTSNPTDGVHVLSRPQWTSGPPLKFGDASPPFSDWTGSTYGFLFNSKDTTGAGWTTGRYCCGGTTGITCPTTGSSLGRCPPPFASGQYYSTPAWTDSTTSFKNGYYLDLIQNTAYENLYQPIISDPWTFRSLQSAMTYTRFITIVVNLAIAGTANTTTLNLCEVVVNGKPYLGSVSVSAMGGPKQVLA